MWESNRYSEYPGTVQGKGKRAKKRPWGMSGVKIVLIKRGVHGGDREGQIDKRDRKRPKRGTSEAKGKDRCSVKMLQGDQVRHR